MARRTIVRSGLVKENDFARDHARRFVASLTAHFAMRSLQRKRRPRIMIEQRRPPLRAVVAFDASRYCRFDELRAVGVFVARLALRRRGSEIGLRERSLVVRRLVASATWCGQVRA